MTDIVELWPIDPIVCADETWMGTQANPSFLSRSAIQRCFWDVNKCEELTKFISDLDGEITYRMLGRKKKIIQEEAKDERGSPISI